MYLQRYTGISQAEFDELTPAETRERIVALDQILAAEVAERVEHTKAVMGVRSGV